MILSQSGSLCIQQVIDKLSVRRSSAPTSFVQQQEGPPGNDGLDLLVLKDGILGSEKTANDTATTTATQELLMVA